MILSRTRMQGVVEHVFCQTQYRFSPGIPYTRPLPIRVRGEWDWLPFQQPLTITRTMALQICLWTHFAILSSSKQLSKSLTNTSTSKKRSKQDETKRSPLRQTKRCHWSFFKRSVWPVSFKGGNFKSHFLQTPVAPTRLRRCLKEGHGGWDTQASNKRL